MSDAHLTWKPATGRSSRTGRHRLRKPPNRARAIARLIGRAVRQTGADYVTGCGFVGNSANSTTAGQW